MINRITLRIKRKNHAIQTPDEGAPPNTELGTSLNTVQFTPVKTSEKRFASLDSFNGPHLRG